MHALAKLRRWANRDDGKYYRVGNHRLNWLEVVGALLAVAALLLNQIRTALGVSGYWLALIAAVGFALLLVGSAKSGSKAGT